jgi:hypothetical protein
MLSRRFSVEVTGISYPLLTFTYHGGRGSESRGTLTEPRAKQALLGAASGNRHYDLR